MGAKERSSKSQPTKAKKPAQETAVKPKSAGKPTKASTSEPSKSTKLSSKRKAVEAEEQVAEEQEVDEAEQVIPQAADEEEDETSEDESDDEVNEDWTGIDVSTLPTIAKDDEFVRKKLEKAKRQPTEDRGVIYLGRIPHGFYETQMKEYFAQFGNVTRLRLSRNKKTGRSRHYAFIEFDSSSVSQIVAETMDNYLLMGHILTCKVIPKDEVHPELWVGANRKFKKVPHDRISRMQHNKPRTEEKLQKAEKRLLKRQAQKKRKLQEAGVQYDFDAVAYKKRPAVVAA